MSSIRASGRKLILGVTASFLKKASSWRSSRRLLGSRSQTQNQITTKIHYVCAFYPASPVELATKVRVSHSPARRGRCSHPRRAPPAGRASCPFLTHAAHGLPDSKVHISHSAISAINEAYSSESLDADLRRGLRAAAHHLRRSLEPRRLAAEALRAAPA